MKTILSFEIEFDLADMPPLAERVRDVLHAFAEEQMKLREEIVGAHIIARGPDEGEWIDVPHGRVRWISRKDEDGSACMTLNELRSWVKAIQA